MQILQAPNGFTFPKPFLPLKPKPYPSIPLGPSPFRRRCFASDEFPVDETFLLNFGLKDKETEDQARRRNWVERDWAPWEEVLSPEADFARKSLDEVELQNPEAIEAFRMLNPNYRAKKIQEMGITKDEWYRKQFDIKGDIPEPLTTVWAGPMVVRQVASKEVVEAMASFNEKPIILALSNPTSQSECTAEEAYTWSEGRAIFANGSPFSPVEYTEKTFHIEA